MATDKSRNAMIKKVFTKVYEDNLWGSEETRSGKGSEIKATKGIIKLLPAIFDKYNITGITEIGCGDHNWMQKVTGLKYYLGIDVVEKLIKINSEKYGSDTIEFECDEFPYWLANFYGEKYQAVMFADVLVHLPLTTSVKYLEAIKETNIKYIFATTFHKYSFNKEMPLDETSWRPLNMEIKPFSLGYPLELIPYIEPYIGENGKMKHDKCLGLWRIPDVEL
jgi:2-polyprenyl-3-methyl-5-hydroxy-6-metoxy-1,4-benzoquinol methylase